MLILASASPRRRELLLQAGFAFTVHPAEIDESPLPNEAASAYVQRLAIEKAQAVCKLHAHLDTLSDPLIVLAADTSVVLHPSGVEEKILGKPRTLAEAESMLTLLAGRTHAVMTGLAAVTPTRTLSDVEITQVAFNLIPPAELDAYLQSGEPMDKAGAYGIQGFAARWIPRIEGDFYNVMGLPIARTVALLAEAAAPPA
jgi:septum formation protein